MTGRTNRKRRNGKKRNGNRSQQGAYVNGTSTRIVDKGRLSNQRDVIQRFVRTTTFVAGLNPTTGFTVGTPAFDLAMSFQLNATNFYLGGTLAASNANPGYTDFTALYDSYKLEKVEIACMYSVNAQTSGTLAAATLPIMNIVFDPNDVSVTSLSSVLQYRNLRTVQMGNQRGDSGYVMEIRPQAVISAIGGTDAVTLLPTWLNIDQADIPHYGVKMFYDSNGSTLNAVIGTMSFYVKYHWAFKLAH